jgi:exonuclease III
MRIVSWNVKRAGADDEVWNVLLQLDPDIALLQEVGKLPEKITSGYSIVEHPYVSKKGKPQNFKTTIVSKGVIEEELNLTSEFEWVNKERKFFSGSIVAHAITIGEKRFNVISVHSPAWSIDEERLKDIDLNQIKLLSKTHEIWCTEILWSILKNSMAINENPWVVGGDFNSSETFDDTWGSGNKEVIERMNNLGLQECLRKHNGKLVPTFKNKIGGKIVHQMDHIYVSDSLLKILKDCNVSDREAIFGNSLSDHLPIIANFDLV